MYYWSYKGMHLILTDQEESRLVTELSESPTEAVLYMADQKIRKKVENKINKYLKKLLLTDRECF